MFVEPAVTRSPGDRHDLAYACFIPPVTVSLVSAVSTVVPMSTGVAGGVGFLLLVPLTLVALVSVPAGIYLSFVHRQDIALPLLSVLTLLMVAVIITEAGPVEFYNAAAWIHGVLGAMLIASWFLARRWRKPAT